MSHVMVQNKGELPVWGIRLLGLSDKTEDKIGKFGTGLKEALALMAREDCLPTIYSGELRIDFSIQTIDGHAEICFRLSENRDRWRSGEWYGMGLHPNYGHHDWHDLWMALREIVCNAQDAGELHHDVLSGEPNGMKGTTRVWLPLKQKMLEAYAAINDRLLFLNPRPPVQCADGIGRAFCKRKLPEMQVYHRGVWVQAAKKRSLFDYELDRLKLNESRSADWWNIGWDVSIMVAKYTVEQAIDLLCRVIKEHDKDFYEHDCLHHAVDHLEPTNNWVEAFRFVFGPNAVLTDTDATTYDRLRRIGKDPVVVADDELYKFLCSAGVRGAMSVLSRAEREYEQTKPVSENTQQLFDQVWDTFVQHGLTNSKDKPRVMLFRQKQGTADIVVGSYHDETCFINEDVVGSAQEKEGIVEEIAHHVTGAVDLSRGFQTYLVQVICRLTV